MSNELLLSVCDPDTTLNQYILMNYQSQKGEHLTQSVFEAGDFNLM